MSTRDVCHPQKANKQNICEIGCLYLLNEIKVNQFNGIFKCMKRLSFLLKSLKNNRKKLAATIKFINRRLEKKTFEKFIVSACFVAVVQCKVRKTGVRVKNGKAINQSHFLSVC